MDRRTFLAISLCFLIFWGWQKFYLEPRLPKQSAVTQQQQTGAQNAATAPPATNASAASTATPLPLKVEEFPVLTGVAKVGNGNRVFTGWDLKTYRLGMAAKDAAVDLSSVTHQSEGEIGLDFESPELAYLANVRGNLTRTPEGWAWVYEDANVKLTRLLRGSMEQSYVGVTLTAEFKKTAPEYAFVSLSAASHEKDSEAADRQLTYWANKAHETVHLSSPIAGPQQVPGPVHWIGASNRYFTLAVVNDGPAQAMGLVQPLPATSQINVDGNAVYPNVGRLSLVYRLTGKQVSIPLKVYFGPKELDLLRSVDVTLDHVVDFGWLNSFAYPLLRLMKWFHGLTGNWGVAIILLTLLVKIALFPLTYKSMKSMKQMAKLQPQLQRIRDKHKDDKEALNREMLTLMRSHGYNPMAGCLPILVQMPIFFALYRVLYSAIELYHAPFMLWIQDLSSKDPFYVTPVLLTGVMYIQQKLTPTTAADPAQQKILQFMPIMFGAFMLTLPSGLTVYMLVNALASIVQQIILNKKLDIHPTAVVPART